MGGSLSSAGALCGPVVVCGLPRWLAKPSDSYRGIRVILAAARGEQPRTVLGRSARRLDQARRTAFRRLEISFSQGAEWKALISEYITTIPSSGDAWRVGEQSISGGPVLRALVSSAMIAKVGEAARDRTWIAAALVPSPIIKMVFVMVLAHLDLSRRSFDASELPHLQGA